MKPSNQSTQTNNNLNAELRSLSRTALSVLPLILLVASLAMTEPAAAGVTVNDPAFSPLGQVQGGEEVALQTIIGNIIKGILGLTGIAALLMFVYGGLSWMLAMGNSQKIETARKTLVWSVPGLFIVFSAYAVVNFVLAALHQ